MSTRKLWDYVIELKKEFVPRKEKKYKYLQRINYKKGIFSHQVTTDFASILCSKKRQQKENGTGLLLYESINNKKQIPIALNYRYSGWSRQEKGIHKTGPQIEIQ